MDLEEERRKIKCAKKPLRGFFRSVVLLFALPYFLFKVFLRLFFGYALVDFSTPLRTIGTFLLVLSVAAFAFKFAKLYYDYRWVLAECDD